MTTSADANTCRLPNLSLRLAEATRKVEEALDDSPALVRLAYAFNGFYVARVVSVLLDAEAVPQRDVFALAEQWCTQALDVLYEVVESRLVRRYCPTHAAGEALLRDITTAGQFELNAASDIDIDRIGDEMIGLADALRRLLNAVAADETTLPHLRGAARAVVPAAENIWSQYGGDGGGW
ncbi:hypothetical protein ACFFMR_31355 [Micromonospora andamanensis]|uniref:hypothetical protein n=1 Tax=Micromonospora andamanensis TaxID=1287068 RepID=UPI001950BC95|nr:hypothetical protein [Micromonospora andamanensis]